MANQSKPTAPAKAKMGKRTRNILLAFVLVPIGYFIISRTVSSVIENVRWYKINTSIDNDSITKSGQVEFDLKCKDFNGKFVFPNKEIIVKQGVETKHAVKLDYGENTVSVNVVCGEKTDKESYTFFRQTPEEIRADSEREIVENCKRNPKKQIEIVQQSWSKGGFGAVAQHSVLLKNNCPNAVKDVEMKATYYASSGTKIDSTTRTTYETIPARSSKWISFSGMVHSQATSTSLTVMDVSVAE